MRRAGLGVLALALTVVPGPAAAVLADPDEDLTPPVLTITPQTGGVDGWYADTATVFVRATDNHTNASGVRFVAWTMSGAQQGSGSVSRTDGGTLTVTSGGVTRLDVEAADANDNSTLGHVSVGIDRDAPTIDFTGAVVDGAEVVQGTTASLTFTCADPLSGVGGCVGSVPSGTAVDTSALGEHTVSVDAWDRVNNRSDRTITYTVVDDEFTIVRGPEIAGTPALGQTLTAVDPQVRPSATGYTYEWLRGNGGAGMPVVGTGRTYQVTAADGGDHLWLRVHPVREGVAPRPLTSLHVTVPLGQIELNAEVGLVGDAVIGGRLAADGLVVQSPASAVVTYTWLRDGAVIEGQTNRWYFPGTADQGHRISVRIQVTSPGYQTRTWTTAETDRVRGRALEVVGEATVRGRARVGATLEAMPPAVRVPPVDRRAPGSVNLSYQWLRDGAAIPDARAATYLLRPADVGHRVSVRVTGSASGYEDAVSTSAPSSSVAKGVPVVRAVVKAGSPGTAGLVVTVRLPGATPTGKVVVTRAGRVVLRGVLRNGVLRAALTRQPRGRLTYTVRYAGAPGIAARAVKASARIR